VHSQVGQPKRAGADEDAIAIGRLYRKGRQAILDGIKFHLQVGRTLIQKKASLNHGEWVPWLRTNADVLGFKHRTTAARLMKAAAANVSSTQPLNSAEAIRFNRTLWGNLIAATAPEAESKQAESKRKRPTKRSAIEMTDRCIEAVRATIEDAVARLQRVQAPRDEVRAAVRGASRNPYRCAAADSWER
jgi:Protein of unknown function (DUF3102)